MEPIRVNLTLDRDVNEMLTELAGGERKRSDYLNQLIRNITESSGEDVTGVDFESLRLMMQGLGGRIKSLEGEVMRVQVQVDKLSRQVAEKYSQDGDQRNGKASKHTPHKPS